MPALQPKVIQTSDPTRVRIEWSDGVETLYRPAELRRLCPCAGCVSETTGIRTLDPASVSDELTQSGAKLVGNYALALRFSDGHETGIYTFPYLRENDPGA